VYYKMPMKFAIVICLALYSLGAGAKVALNDTIDPSIPDYLFDQDVCGEVNLIFPPVIPPQEGFLTITLTDSSENSMSGVEIVVVIGNWIDGYIEYFPVMTNPFSETFIYPISGTSGLEFETNFGSSTDFVVIENCVGVVFEGLVNSLPEWGLGTGCQAEPLFYGNWSICEGPGDGVFSQGNGFSTVFNPEAFGVYTLCFQSFLTDSVYEFIVNVKELGCPDPSACNFTSFDDCDFGGCIYNCSECDNYLEGPIFFADGSLFTCKGDTIHVDSAVEGEIIDTVDDLNSFWLAVEHSYLGDLEITYTCPNGQNLIVHDWGDGGGGTFLGEPIDDGTTNIGVCYTYYFVDFSGNGTMGDQDVETIPAGGYTSSEPWENLLGCPINGDWSLEVCDNLAIDNGFICGWGIYFDNDVLNKDCQDVVSSGCFDPEACNYNSEASIDDMSCAYPGCTNPLACNFNVLAGCDSGTCVLPGCVDSSACNYEISAGCDDGSCLYFGCTDSLACNYSELNGCEDGSCDYSLCVDYDFTFATTNYCDSTVLTYGIDSISPEWAIAILSIPNQGYYQEVEPGMAYTFVLIGGGSYGVYLEFELSESQTDPFQFWIESIQVFTAPTAPELELWETTLFCTNCTSSQVFNWYIDGELVSEEIAIEIVGMAFYELCTLVQFDGGECSTCSEPFIIENIPVHKQGNVEIYGNGSTSPSFIISQGPTSAKLFDITGKHIQSFIVNPNEEIKILNIGSGQYVLRIDGEAVLIEVVE
jgi:subtilisin-like proprotein convertase family protein